MILNRSQGKILGIGVIGIVGIYFLSIFVTEIHSSLNDIGRVRFMELFAAIIGVSIFILKEKFKNDELKYFELLMMIIIGVSAGIDLLPRDVFDPALMIVVSIIVLVGWFVFFGLLKYLRDENRIAKTQFLTMLIFFIGLTIIILLAFDIIRVNELFTPNVL